MEDSYWNRQQPLLPLPGPLKRNRSDYDALTGIHSVPEIVTYAPRDADRAEADPRSLRDTKTIESAYDRYLQSMQLSSSGEASTFSGSVLGKPAGNKLPGVPVGNHVTTSRPRAVSPDIATNGRNIHYDNQLPVDSMSGPGREIIRLPPDASNTLYVEGLPSDISKREVAHIFRPFVGYKQLRLVNKESKTKSVQCGDPLILCFVDFMNAACAATAMSALQGYKIDEHDSDSNYLRLQFSRHPGPRSTPGSSRR